MLALGLGAVLCGCALRPAPGASPAAPGPVQPSAAEASATPAAAAVATRAPLADARVVWLDDNHFQLASNHVFQLNKDCLSMPYQGRQVELCSREMSKLNSQWDPGPDAVKSPDGRQLAWLVPERTDTTVFCWRYENTERLESSCYAVPTLGISPQQARHPVFRFLQEAKTIYVVDPSHVATTEVMHALFSELPPHNQSPDCVALSVEIDEMLGEVELREPPIAVTAGHYAGREITFVYHLHFDGGLSGEAVTAHTSADGGAETFCDFDVGEVVAITRDHVELEHEGKVRRWYGNRYACQSDAQQKPPSSPIGPCVHWHASE